MDLKLDVLQRAIVTDNYESVHKTLETVVNIRDFYNDSSPYVNHPVHLACAFEATRCLPLLLEFFGEVEEGEVSITYSPLGPWPEVLVRQPLRYYQKGNVVELAEHSEKSLAKLYHYYFGCTVRESEDAWTFHRWRMVDVLDRLSRKTSTWTLHSSALQVLQDDFSCVNPVFERICTLPLWDWPLHISSYITFLRKVHIASSCSNDSTKRRGTTDSDTTSDGISTPSDTRASTTEAGTSSPESSGTAMLLSLMTVSQLQLFAKALKREKYLAPFLLEESHPVDEELLAMLDKALQSRTLREECIQAVLRSTGGRFFMTRLLLQYC